MNALNIANNLFSLTTTNKNMLLVAVVAFGMLCIYKMITGPDWFAKILGVVLLVVAVGVLSGCNGPTDPLGATSRTRLRTDASVSIANADANARIAQAQADEAARIAESNARIITTMTQETGATARASTWAGMIPLALLIVGAAVVVALVVNWQGRIWLERTRQAPQLVQRQAWPTLSAEQVLMLYDHARRTGQRVIVDAEDGSYCLTDGQRTVKALLKG